MIIQASNGCFLTQSEDVAFKERRFEKSMLVASMKEASLWKEIPESEKAQMEAENSIYEPDTIDYDYLKKSMHSKIRFLRKSMNRSCLQKKLWR